MQEWWVINVFLFFFVFCAIRLYNNGYLIPIKIHAHLIFAHLACANIKESKFAQCESYMPAECFSVTEIDRLGA